MRGRKPNQMTTRRKQVLNMYIDLAAEGQTPSLSRLARECGLYDYRKVRRILADLKKMNRLD